MQMTIDMPVVADCTVRECAYNVDQACYARAITIGNGVHPGCDTFFEASSHSGVHRLKAGVGACKVSACGYNDDFECQAERIQVARRGTEAYCMTFSAR